MNELVSMKKLGVEVGEVLNDDLKEISAIVGDLFS